MDRTVVFEALNILLWSRSEMILELPESRTTISDVFRIFFSEAYVSGLFVSRFGVPEILSECGTPDFLR